MARPRPPQRSPPRAPDIPDRPLEPAGELPTVAVRAAGNHPFVYRKMVIGPVGATRPADGDLVRVVDRDHLPLGFGLWNGRSQISLRLLAPGDRPSGPRLLEAAGSIRPSRCGATMLGLDGVTNAYRVVHAEGDGLSGLIVDRFDDVLSVEIFSLGMYQRIGPILDLLAERLGTRHFRVHVDERIALAEDFSGRPLASPELPPRVTIHEHGVRFRVHFEGGHKTGFFCDQRDNRRDLARYLRGPLGARRLLLHRGLRHLRPGPGQGPRGHLRRPRREGGRPGAARTPTPTRSGRRSSTPTPSATCGRWRSTAGPSASSCSTPPS